MSWYRTYRPQTIAGLHLPSVREALGRIRDSGKFGHAYILTGPKGTGKTSSARILAKMLNCEKNAVLVQAQLQGKTSKVTSFVEPCGVCSSCKAIAEGSSMAVLEMDAASNRGIDDVRSLKEKVHVPPAGGAVAVYIIDEVHMLTTEAFNALLKVLEEPPAHVVFILATTEHHKLPATILSRCTVIRYQKARPEELGEALRAIVKQEKLKVEDGALEEMAKLADGSFRDAVKLLETLSQGRVEIKREDLESVAGLSQDVLKNFVHALRTRSLKTITQTLQDLEQSGRDVVIFQKAVVQYLHAVAMAEAAAVPPKKSLQEMLKLLQVINIAPDAMLPFPQLPFESACIAWCLEKNQEWDEGDSHEQEPASSSEKPKIKQDVKKNEKNSSNTPSDSVQEKVEVIIESNNTQPVLQEKAPTVSLSFEDLVSKWPHILQEIRSKNSSLEGLLRNGQLTAAEGNIITIEVYFAFHKEQLEQEKNRRIMETVLKNLYGDSIYKLNYVVGDKSKRVQKKKAEGEALVAAAAEAFA